ncbi:MAG: hypothetical protein ACRDHL_14315 [Candidatus Promineifilaceae bacterium]
MLTPNFGSLVFEQRRDTQTGQYSDWRSECDYCRTVPDSTGHFRSNGRGY